MIYYILFVFIYVSIDECDWYTHHLTTTSMYLTSRLAYLLSPECVSVVHWRNCTAMWDGRKRMYCSMDEKWKEMNTDIMIWAQRKTDKHNATHVQRTHMIMPPSNWDCKCKMFVPVLIRGSICLGVCVRVKLRYRCRSRCQRFYGLSNRFSISLNFVVNHRRYVYAK